jgi:hypothetical protein
VRLGIMRSHKVPLWGNISQLQTMGGPVISIRNRRLWVADEASTTCTDCGSEFSLMLRRHHCRGCGDIFCASCSASQCVLLHLDATPPVRIQLAVESPWSQFTSECQRC